MITVVNLTENLNITHKIDIQLILNVLSNTVSRFMVLSDPSSEMNNNLLNRQYTVNVLLGICTGIFRGTKKMIINGGKTRKVKFKKTLWSKRSKATAKQYFEYEFSFNIDFSEGFFIGWI